MTQPQEDLPRVGMMLLDKTPREWPLKPTAAKRVIDVFPAGQEHGMTLEWTGYNPSTDAVGRRAQGFTTRDWRERWKEVR